MDGRFDALGPAALHVARPARPPGIGAVRAVAGDARKARVRARRRAVVGRARLAEGVRGVALLAEAAARVEGLRHGLPVLHDLLEEELGRFEVELFGPRIERNGPLRARLRERVAAPQRVATMAGEAGDGGAPALRGVAEAPDARQLLRRLDAGEAALRRNTREDCLHIAVEEHPVAAQALVRRLPRPVVVFVQEELCDGRGVSAARPACVLLLVAASARGAHALNLRLAERQIAAEGGVVRRRHVAPRAAQVVPRRRERGERAAVARLAAHVRVYAVGPAVARAADLVAAGAGLRRRRALEPGERAQAREEAEERQGDESGPKCLHHLTPPGPDDGRRCPAPRGSRAP